MASRRRSADPRGGRRGGLRGGARRATRRGGPTGPPGPAAPRAVTCPPATCDAADECDRGPGARPGGDGAATLAATDRGCAATVRAADRGDDGHRTRRSRRAVGHERAAAGALPAAAPDTSWRARAQPPSTQAQLRLRPGTTRCGAQLTAERGSPRDARPARPRVPARPPTTAGTASACPDRSDLASRARRSRAHDMRALAATAHARGRAARPAGERPAWRPSTTWRQHGARPRRWTR